MDNDDFVRKCKIQQNDLYGRYATAAVDIKAGETILLERPVVIMATENEKRCANCLKLADKFCSACNVFPLCDNCQQHNSYDCEKFAQMKELSIAELQNNVDIYGLLKCLLLRENPETAKYFEQINQMEAHTEKRRNTEIWKQYERQVISPLLKSGISKYLREPIDGELLQRLCGIIDVNCFEIRGPAMTPMRGLYPRAALLAHDCVANTVISIDEQYQMKIYANRDIAKDELLFNCYANVLLGTDERREMLRIGKYFHCSCARCEDPTELGSHMSSFICTRCAEAQRKDGYMVKTVKDNVWSWRCLICDHILKADHAAKILERVREEIFHAKDDIYRYELLLAKLGSILHRNHYLMIDLKQNIAAILRAIIGNMMQRPGPKVYERKVRLCQEILSVLNIIQPGISRLKAIALYELCTASAELARMRFSEKAINELELRTELQQTELMLRESVRMLLYEPIETPEGQLAKSMIGELKQLKNDIRLLQADADSSNQIIAI